MATVEIVTEIQAPIERCFDLARSIDLHSNSLRATDEQAVAGVTSGLISMGEQVTWSARHFGFCQKLTSRITAFDRPKYFRDSMVQGAFSRFDHEHHFSHSHGITALRDIFDFESPLGLLGRIFDRYVLANYMKQLLCIRNAELKRVAESETEWQQYFCR